MQTSDVSSTNQQRKKVCTRDNVIAADVVLPPAANENRLISQMRNTGPKDPIQYGSAPAVQEQEAAPGQLGVRGRTGPDWAVENNMARNALGQIENLPARGVRAKRQTKAQLAYEDMLRSKIRHEAQMDVQGKQRVARY